MQPIIDHLATIPSVNQPLVTLTFYYEMLHTHISFLANMKASIQYIVVWEFNGRRVFLGNHFAKKIEILRSLGIQFL